MRRFRSVLVTTMVVLGSAGPARAVIPLSAPHLAERVALADAVVVAQVDDVKEDLAYAFPILKIPGAKKMPFQIADLSVGSVIVGRKEWWASKTRPTLQAGYIVARAANGEDLSRFRRFATVKLSLGEEGCFFLRQHPEESFYVLQNAYDVIDKAKSKEFDKDVALIRKCAGLLKNPKAGLQAKEKQDRILTAAMLLCRYRAPQFIYTGRPKTVAIEAEESRQILAILREADWSEEKATEQLAPGTLFNRLDLTEEDGWVPPKDPKEYSRAAQKWLRDHAGTYRIQKYVPE